MRSERRRDRQRHPADTPTVSELSWARLIHSPVEGRTAAQLPPPKRATEIAPFPTVFSTTCFTNKGGE
jgi:hypothetical protein